MAQLARAVAAEHLHEAAPDLHELTAARAQTPEGTGQVVDRGAALAAEAVPAAFGRLVDVEARARVFMKRAPDLAVAPDGLAREGLDVDGWLDRAERVVLAQRRAGFGTRPLARG